MCTNCVLKPTLLILAACPFSIYFRFDFDFLFLFFFWHNRCVSNVRMANVGVLNFEYSFLTSYLNSEFKFYLKIQIGHNLI